MVLIDKIIGIEIVYTYTNFKLNKNIFQVSYFKNSSNVYDRVPTSLESRFCRAKIRYETIKIICIVTINCEFSNKNV